MGSATAGSGRNCTRFESFPSIAQQPLDEWHLPDYIAAAERLKMLHADTVAEARLAQNFRNLIHPGRSQRLGHKCDRGTAFIAAAAADHIVRDFS